MGLGGSELCLYVIKITEHVDKTEFCMGVEDNFLKKEGQISCASDLFLILLFTA